MLVGVYLDPRRSSTTSKTAESGIYEAFVMVLYCHFINEVLRKLRGRGYWISNPLYILGKSNSEYLVRNPVQAALPSNKRQKAKHFFVYLPKIKRILLIHYPLPLNCPNSVLSLLLLKHYLIYKMAIEDHNKGFIIPTFCIF